VVLCEAGGIPLWWAFQSEGSSIGKCLARMGGWVSWGLSAACVAATTQPPLSLFSSRSSSSPLSRLGWACILSGYPAVGTVTTTASISLPLSRAHVRPAQYTLPPHSSHFPTLPHLRRDWLLSDVHLCSFLTLHTSSHFSTLLHTSPHKQEHVHRKRLLLDVHRCEAEAPLAARVRPCKQCVHGRGCTGHVHTGVAGRTHTPAGAPLAAPHPAEAAFPG
jgi:hypothetical protein